MKPGTIVTSPLGDNWIEVHVEGEPLRDDRGRVGVFKASETGKATAWATAQGIEVAS